MKKSANRENCEKMLGSETWEVNATPCHDVKGRNWYEITVLLKQELVF